MQGQPRIDEALSTRDGHLFIEEVDTVGIVGEYGSPVFVASENQLRRNIRRFSAAFQSRWSEGPVMVMPAVKASWSTAVQTIIASEGCGCDVYSAGELAIALKVGFNPSTISVNGMPKTPEHVANAVRAGARLTIDGPEEIDFVEQAAREQGTHAQVRLRIKPANSGFVKASDFVPQGPLPTDVASLAYKGGLSRDTAIAIGRRVLDSPHLDLVGFHQHNGRHHPSAEYWYQQMVAYADEIGAISRALGGYQPREISTGGGFAVPRDPFGSEIRYADTFEFFALQGLSTALSKTPKLRYRVLDKLVEKSMLFTPNQTIAPTYEDYAEAVTTGLRDALPRNGIRTDGLVLQLEPGRSLHGNTAIHLTSVHSIKRMTSPVHWNHAALDTTEFWFTGGRYEHHIFDFIFANKTDAPLTEKFDVVGRSCYGDRMFPAVKVPADISRGDIMAILDVGAYQEVSMSNFNAMPRPATLLVTGDKVNVIRKAESQDDVFARDELPAHLRSAAEVTAH